MKKMIILEMSIVIIIIYIRYVTIIKQYDKFEAISDIF